MLLQWNQVVSGGIRYHLEVFKVSADVSQAQCNT
jgi:hypothetical protein